jgi:hypothetical protein
MVAQSPLEIRLSNGSVIASTHTATLDLPFFPTAARQDHILPGLAQHYVLSVGKNCDNGCAVTFTENKVAIKHGAATILTGTRDKDSGLWRVPVGATNSEQSVPQHTSHNVYEKKSIQDTIFYSHACCFSPVQDTWIKSIQNGQFATWPSLMVDNVRKYIPKSDTMVKGHMHQIHQHIRSTQTAVREPTPEPEMVQEDNCSYIYYAAIMEKS